MTEKEDDLDELLDPDKTKKEKRVERTKSEQDELGDYNVEQDRPDNYDLDNVYDDMQEIKEAVKQQTENENNGNKYGASNHRKDYIELAQKKELDQRLDKAQHKHHAAYAIALGGGIALLGYDINGYFFWAIFFPLLAYLKTGLNVKEPEKQNWYYRLVDNHVMFYIGGLMGVVTIKAAAGEPLPIPAGIRQEFAKQSFEILIAMVG